MAQQEFTDEFFNRILNSEAQCMRHAHPSFQTLIDFIYGELDQSSLSRVSAHVRVCPQCADRVEAIRNQIDQLSEGLSKALPDPLKILRRRTVLQSLKRIFPFHWFRRRPAEERLSRLGVGRSWAFAMSVLLLAVIGTFLGMHLQITALNREVISLKQSYSEVAKLGNELGELRQALASYGEGVSAQHTELGLLRSEVTQLRETIESSLAGAPVMSLEGATDESLIEVTINKDLSGYLRIYERVRGEVLFEGIVKKGSKIMKFGQSFEISWPQKDGADAVVVTGWEKVKRTEEGWKKVSEPRVITDIKLKEGKLFIIFP